GDRRLFPIRLLNMFHYKTLRTRPACPIGSDRALDGALITSPEARDATELKKLDAVAGRVLKVL
ncbi:MAG: hypothetical protein ACKOW3_10155, partial [Hyphomicrobium sp.]